MKIFPCSHDKIPLIKNWNDLATNDPNQIRLWQELYKDKLGLWGIPCGAVNGFFVLDIDVKKANGWETLKRLGYQIPDTLRQDTPSGGSHFFFKAHPGRHYPNSVNADFGLDTRGDRGFVAFYGFINPGTLLAEAPDWLFKLSPERKVTETPQAPFAIVPEISEGAFKACIDAVINAPAGESNDTLNREAFKVGQLVASGAISRAFAEAELFRAAKLRGKPDFEARATITSGLNGGVTHPLVCPFPATGPTTPFVIPAPPLPPARWTPRYLTREDLLNRSRLRKPQLFKDWSSEDISITTADGGTGKTTLKLYEAICLALGDRFLGFECVSPGKTLFITGEDTDLKLAAMLGAIMGQMGLFIDSEENERKVQVILSSIVIKKDADLCLIAKTRDGFLHPNREAMDKLLQAIEDIQPKLIVFDPIASFWGSESALNDMNKAVTRFMSELVDRGSCAVEMINHMGKSSSSSKDISQFAGRGGSGLPSNSRICRVIHTLTSEEYEKMTGADLFGEQTAMQCVVNKYSDGSPLLNKPFIIVRDGFLFHRVTLSPQKLAEAEKTIKDDEIIFNWVKAERAKDKWPTHKAAMAHFMNCEDAMSEGRVRRGLANAIYQGFKGERVIEIPNVDLTSRDKMLTIVDCDGREI